MMRWLRWTPTVMVLLLGLALALPASAQRVKEAVSSLDHIVFARPELRVPETNTDADLLRDRLQNIQDLDVFRAEHGAAWRFTIDERRDRVALLDGGAIPFIPGHANGLQWENFDSHCRSNSCVSRAKVEALARQFLAQNTNVFKVDPAELVLDPEGTTAIGDSIYLLRFQWTYAGIPVERGSVYFRINGGNLIQVGTENIGPISLNPVPAFGAATAWENLQGYMGNIWQGDEKILDHGSLLIVPITPKGKDPNLFSGPLGSQIDYRLVYSLVFKRAGVIGTWEALVDAHDGEIVTLRDTNRYGRVHGGVYITDGFPPEADHPFPFADIGGGLYSSEGGTYTGNNATVTLVGKYTHITDDCGAISNVTTTGDADFGMSAGTDCAHPSPNNGGAGNTHAARTLFYMATQINMKARTYLPTNTWLNTSFITCHVNQPAYCNASSGGGTINFYKASPPCTNLGEIPGVALHEWGHSMDDYDGSGGDSPPVETRADWTATLQTHDSCTGRGAFTDGNCSGYGDPCTDCTGIRDADRTKHSNTAPWTVINGNGTVYDCGGGGSYNGPCGWEDHCESGISSQALWELVTVDLPALSSMDVTSAWMLNDRFFYTSMPTLGNMYTCTPPSTSNGCGAASIYTTYRAIDDTGDGTANGTPNAAAIFSALNRHLIACGAAGDATNQNQSSCPGLAKVVATGTPGSNSVNLTWGAIANATRYFVFRNDTGCDAGFTRIGMVVAPTTTFTDPNATNGLMSYYRVQAAAASDSCVGPTSDCVSVTPQPCAGSVLLDKSIYNCNDTVNVTMVDSNVPGDPATVTVTAWSTTDATVKTITLNKTVFANYSGSFTTTAGAAGANQVRVADGATITVRYVDVDYCGTPNVNVDATASADCAVPVITNVHSTVAGTIVHILWTTNEPADSYTAYDTVTPPAANTMADAALLTSHDLLLTGLTPCTDYYYFVRSTDIAGNVATANNGGAYYTFSTGQNVMPTYAYTGAPVPILDNATVNAPITVPDNKVVQNVIVTITNITHSFDGDLDISLVAPDNTVVDLSSDNGSSGDNYINTVFDDTASAPITGGTAPFTGTFRPEGLLSTMNGKNALGNWTLRVADDAGGDTGAINGWSITFTYPAQGCGPSLEYVSETYTSVCPAGGAGNGDTIIDAGEDVSITPTVGNNGTAITSNVQATLACSTPGVTITTGAATFGNINPGATAPSAAPFVIHVATSVPCGTQLDFTIHMTCTEKPAGYDGFFSLVVGEVVPGGGSVLDENFASGIPATWTIVDGGSGGGAAATWTTANPGARSATAPITTPFAIVDSDNAGSSATQDEQLITPLLDLTSATTAAIEFDQYWNTWSLGAETGDVDVRSSNTGGTWVNVFRNVTGTDSANPDHRIIDITTHAVGASDVQVRFYYYGGAYDYYWMVDNVKVTYVAPGACNMNICASSTCNLTCTASAAPATGNPPLTVNFTATATPTGCIETPSFSWTFGDGATSTLQNPSHQYPTLGTYTWTLDVVADGKHCTQTGTINVVPPCTMTCTATATPTSGNTPLTVQFSSTVTSANCAGVPVFAWVFGDGTTSALQNPSHIYTTTAAQTFTWSLTVTLNGVTCTKGGTISVSTYDINLFDDAGKGRICIDSQGGRWKYTILRGPGVGTYTGQGTVNLLNGVLYLSSPATAPIAVTAKYYKLQKKGSATINIKASRVTSTITDSNTTNNPPGC